jgi:hypothetical protein
MDTRSKELFEAARRHIPGGVNSPVRAFGSVGRTPRFIASAHGSRIVDVDGLIMSAPGGRESWDMPTSRSSRRFGKHAWTG